MTSKDWTHIVVVELIVGSREWGSLATGGCVLSGGCAGCRHVLGCRCAGVADVRLTGVQAVVVSGPLLGTRGTPGGTVH